VAEANLPDGAELLRAGRRVALVEDTITTGGSLQKAIDVLRELGCEVVAVASLVERHESEGKALRGQGFEVLSLFRTDETGKLSVNPAWRQI
jgi:orotate phosphoribosyltransferase